VRQWNEDTNLRPIFKQSKQCTGNRRIRIPESQKLQELQELRQNIVKYSYFDAKIRKYVRVRVRFRVRVLIRFTCDSYVFAYVVYCILRHSDVGNSCNSCNSRDSCDSGIRMHPSGNVLTNSERQRNHSKTSNDTFYFGVVYGVAAIRLGPSLIVARRRQVPPEYRTDDPTLALKLSSCETRIISATVTSHGLHRRHRLNGVNSYMITNPGGIHVS